MSDAIPPSGSARCYRLYALSVSQYGDVDCHKPRLALAISNAWCPRFEPANSLHCARDVSQSLNPGLFVSSLYLPYPRLSGYTHFSFRNATSVLLDSLFSSMYKMSSFWIIFEHFQPFLDEKKTYVCVCYTHQLFCLLPRNELFDFFSFEIGLEYWRYCVLSQKSLRCSNVPILKIK